MEEDAPFAGCGWTGPASPIRSFDGFYVYGTWFLTGETRQFRDGNFDRVKPQKPVEEGGAGAFELTVRYDRLDLSETPVLAHSGNRAESLTLGLN